MTAKTIADKVLEARNKAIFRKAEFVAAEKAYFEACDQATFADSEGAQECMFVFLKDSFYGGVWAYTEGYKRQFPRDACGPIESHQVFLMFRAAYAAKIKARNRYTSAVRRLMTIGVLESQS